MSQAYCRNCAVTPRESGWRLYRLLFVRKEYKRLLTVRFTNGGSILPLYKVSVLLKTGGADRFMVTRKIDVVIQASLERFDSVLVKGKDYFCCRGWRFESQYDTVFLKCFFISFSFHFISTSFCINFSFENAP